MCLERLFFLVILSGLELREGVNVVYDRMAQPIDHSNST